MTNRITSDCKGTVPFPAAGAIRDARILLLNTHVLARMGGVQVRFNPENGSPWITEPLAGAPGDYWRGTSRRRVFFPAAYPSQRFEHLYPKDKAPFSNGKLALLSNLVRWAFQKDCMPLSHHTFLHLPIDAWWWLREAGYPDRVLCYNCGQLIGTSAKWSLAAEAPRCSDLTKCGTQQPGSPLKPAVNLSQPAGEPPGTAGQPSRATGEGQDGAPREEPVEDARQRVEAIAANGSMTWWNEAHALPDLSGSRVQIASWDTDKEGKPRYTTRWVSAKDFWFYEPSEKAPDAPAQGGCPEGGGAGAKATEPPAAPLKVWHQCWATCGRLDCELWDQIEERLKCDHCGDWKPYRKRVEPEAPERVEGRSWDTCGQEECGAWYAPKMRGPCEGCPSWTLHPRAEHGNIRAKPEAKIKPKLPACRRCGMPMPCRSRRCERCCVVCGGVLKEGWDSLFCAPCETAEEAGQIHHDTP